MPERIEVELTPHAPTRGRVRASPPAAIAPVERPPIGDGTVSCDSDRAPGHVSWFASDRGRLVVTATVVGVVGVLFGWMLGRTSGAEPDETVAEDATATSAADSRPSTGPFASADTLPEADIEPPRTTAPRTTTTLAETVVSPIELDQRISGLPVRLVGLRSDNRLVEIDLTVGTLSERRVPAISGFEPGLVVAGDDWILLPQIDGSRMRLLRDDGTESELSVGDQWAVVVVPERDELWRTGMQQGFGDTLTYERVDLLGEPLGTPIEMPWRSWAVAADPSGGLVTTVNGKVYRIDETGVEQLALGELIGLSTNVVIVRQCDETMQCGLQVVDRATGEIRDVPGDPTETRGSDVESLLNWGRSHNSVVAPDDTAVVVVAPGPNTIGLGLVDLGSGRFTPMAEYAGSGTVAWSPDGRFVFYLDGGIVSALDRWNGDTFTVASNPLTWTGLTSRPVTGADRGVTSATTGSVAEEAVEG